VSRIHLSHPYLRPLASRLALWLSFLAVLSALAAPAAALSMDMRSGKLGGVCNVDTSKGAAFNAASSPAQGDAIELSAHDHCAWCGSPGLALLPTGAAACAQAPLRHMAAASAPSARTLQVTGLPFSRGPPSL
jgi:hypothetical protein